jgi:outer membrane protein assembly factor BamA/autotransporter translocation and assembly factor TamB
MWGCLKALLWLMGGTFLLLVILIGGGWWYLGSSNFADYVRKKIEANLEFHLERDVTIERIEFHRNRPQSIIIRNLRIANDKRGTSRDFALVREVKLTGGVQSFWGRNLSIERVDVQGAQLFYEIFADGTHNFPKWKTGPKRSFQIVHVDIGKLYIKDSAFTFFDQKHDIAAVAQNLESTVSVTEAEGLYEGLVKSSLLRVRIQDYNQFDLTMNGGFRYTPGKLALRSIALRGQGIEAFLSGMVDPLTEAAYDFKLQARVALPRVKEIFKVEQVLDGAFALDSRLRGKAGEFALTGGWSAPRIEADAYELTNARGSLNVTGNNLMLDVERANYGGGTIGAHYVLANYAEPYPMRVDLRYDRISIEQLFSDWTVENTGLRAAATGRLTYQWNKDDILGGSGEGTAALSKNAVAFSRAKYPIAVSGSTDYALDKGTVTFRRMELDTDSSHVSMTGSLRIEDLNTDLRMAIRSSDFAELDRIGYNFAHSADKKDYTLLGLGGAGTINGTVSGPLEKPMVVANITGTQVQYSNVRLGDAAIDLRYDGNRSVLTFDRAVFNDAGGRLALEGTIGFPENGDVRFDIAVEANAYPAQRAIDAVGLDLQIGEGLATGRMLVAGTPDNGRATFVNTVIRRADATLALNGTVNWMPGEGNVAFDLDIAATNFPVADIAKFLDFANVPVTGDLTGTLKIAGRKESLEGSGSVTVRNGAIQGEPIDLVSADLVFTQGRMRATNVLVRAAAGEIRGEAEVDLANERFSYTIASAALDLSKFKLLEGLRDMLGGTITLSSTGAGTFTQPELVLEATLSGGTLAGLQLPAGSAPPSLYIAIRNGRLIVRGAIADIVTIEGEGAVGENLAVDGNVRVTVSDIARAVALSPMTASLPAAGNFVIDMRLGGRLNPIEALIVEATAPVFNLTFAEQQFTTPEPLRIALRNGRIEFDSFALRAADSTFAVTGFAEISGAKRIDVDVRGRVEAALLQLFVTDLRAEGHSEVAISIGGTMSDPRIIGSAELVDAEIKFAGFPQLIDDINGTLRFRGDRIEIESIRATVGGGQVVLGGSITTEGLAPKSVRITIQGTEVALRAYEGLTLEGNFTLLLTGGLDRAMLQGDIDVTRALYFRDFDFQQTLLDILLARSRVTTVSTATWQDRVGLNIHLNANDTLAVRNNIAEVTGSARLDVTGTVANPVILGEVTLDEGGEIRIQNVDYRVARGTIAFQNPFRIDPYLDITFEGTVSGFGASETEGGPYEVTVNLTGTLDRLTPTITSDPPASDITLFSILGFGGIGSRDTSQQAGGLGAYGTSLLYQSIGTLIGSRVFPFVDSFAYDPGTLDTGTGAGPRVTFEKRLSNDVRFLIVYNLDDNQSKQVVEWLVNPSWTLQLTRDEADEYRIDARFRRRYEAHWEFRNDELRNIAEAAVMRSENASEAPAALPRIPSVTAVNTRAADNQPIAQINFRADAGFDTSTLAQEVTLRPGQPVTVRELQSSIKNLYATGNFRDIRVDAQPGPGGVVLTFALFLHYRVGDINIEGMSNNDRQRARRDLTVRTGEILSLDDVDDSAREIQEALVRNGYLEATVDPETNFDRARNTADVHFYATPGPQAAIATVILEGNTAPFDRAEVLGAMRRREGRSFRLDEAREDANRMQNFFVRRDHRRARVEFLGHTYDNATHGVTLRYRATAGPVVKVAVEGVPRSQVRRWLPFARNQEYSEDAIDQAADRIVQGLQQRGHYQAAVDTESELQNNVWTTTFHVSAGPRYRVADVQFTGNIKVPEKELEGLVETNPSGGFRRLIASLFRRPTGVTNEQISDDRDNVESYYRLQGFSEAVVDTPVVQTNDAAGTMTVTFPITEGPQTLVTDVRIEGVAEHRDIPSQQLVSGAPLNPQLLHDDVVALQTYFANEGYTEVQVTPRTQISEDKTAATVTYIVSEGPRVEVDEVIVRGNTYTDRDVVLRKAGIENGDPFSYTSMLEAQRDLYRLGIFQRVEVQPEQAGTSVSDRDVVITVEEGKNLTLTGAVGLRATRGDQNGTTTPDETPGDPADDNDGGGMELHERVTIAAAHRNLFGTGRYLGIELVGGREEREAFLTYREPFISRWNVPLQLQVFQSDDQTRPGVQILQKGTSIEATKVAGLQTRWSMRYEYKISKCDGGEICAQLASDVPIDPELDLDPELRSIQISSITPTFFWDRRDDIIDPHSGFFTSASVEYAFPLFSAKAGFLKEYLQGAYYLPIGEKTVLALSGRIGFIQPYAKKEDSDELLGVPLSERFTAGGETTHRAFALDRLGNVCDDPREPADCEPTLLRINNGRILPLGGNSLFLANAEYRFPIFGPVGGAVFADVGNVFAGSRIKFDQLRYGGGIGVRYLSPVGPLRIDFAMPVRAYEWEDKYQYFITLGYAF